jgi:hypothetical protein
LKCSICKEIFPAEHFYEMSSRTNGRRNLLGVLRLLLLNDLMDRRTLENWQKVKEALEKAIKTDSMFYKRSVAILSGKPDPLK